MTIISVCGAVLICLIFIICFGKNNAKSGFIVGIGVSIMLLIASIDNIIPIFSYIKSLMELSEGSVENISVMLKCTGIGLISSFTCQLCKSCNEDGIASGVDFFAKTEIVILCLPVIKSLLEIATANV